MAQNEERLRRTQAGIETTRGTPVAPTIRLTERIRLMDAYEPLDLPADDGTYDAWTDFLQGPVNVAGTAEGAASFERLPYWMEHGIKGGVVASSDGHTTSPAYTRLYSRNPDVDDLASSTMEHGAPDNVYRSEMVMVPEWTIRGDIDGDATWMFSGRLLARDKDPLPGGFTAGVAAINRELVKAAGTRVYVDDTAAGLGTTLVAGKAISFSVTWNNAVTPKRFLENESEISARVGRGLLQVTGQLRIEFDSDDEMANYRTAAPRAIRIERTGSVIHAASATPSLPETRKRVRIDIPTAYWLTPSDDPRESNMTLTFGFRSVATPSVGYPARIEIVNQLAAIS